MRRITYSYNKFSETTKKHKTITCVIVSIVIILLGWGIGILDCYYIHNFCGLGHEYEEHYFCAPNEILLVFYSLAFGVLTILCTILTSGFFILPIIGIYNICKGRFINRGRYNYMNMTNNYDAIFTITSIHSDDEDIE